jgi:predicted TIM-barrel fold metal-dependent hydrolase
MQTLVKTNGTSKPKHIVDTHRHPLGPKLIAKMVGRGLYDPTKSLPQVAAGDVFVYRTLVDLEYAMPIQREGGVTLSVASNGGEVEWLARDILQTSTNDTLRFLNDEYLEIRDRYPGEFALMANAHALDEGCRPVVEDMLSRNNTKAIAICSSYNVLADREFLDSPKAEWLWEFAAASGVAVHVHPPNMAISHEAATKYRLNEALARPYDTALSIARMIGSGVFDRHPKLQVIAVHMGGDLMSVLGRLDFCWQLNYNGIENPPADKVALNVGMPSEYFRTNILVDSFGFSSLGLRAAIDMCGIDRVLFGTDFGPVPFGVRDQVDIVAEIALTEEDRDKVYWKNSDTVFGLGLGSPALVSV